MPSTVLLGQEQGATQLLHADSDGQSFVIETVADVEPVLEANKAAANESDGFGPSREWRRVACIPAIIQLRWKELYGIEAWNKDHWPGVKRLLNDPDWRWLRTSPGRI